MQLVLVAEASHGLQVVGVEKGDPPVTMIGLHDQHAWHPVRLDQRRAYGEVERVLDSCGKSLAGDVRLAPAQLVQGDPGQDHVDRPLDGEVGATHRGVRPWV